MFHPASLLVAWAFAVVAMQGLDISVYFMILLLLGAAGSSWLVLRRLIWRSRWLFVAITLLFLWMTPGLLLPGLPGRLGITDDGLRLVAVQILHFLSLLVLVALLLSRMATTEIMSGLYALFKPLQVVKGLRQRLALRLMLTLEYAGTGQLPHISKDATELAIQQPCWTLWDTALLAALVGLTTQGMFAP